MTKEGLQQTFEEIFEQCLDERCEKAVEEKLNELIEKIDSEEQLDQYIESFERKEVSLGVGEVELDVQLGSLSDEGAISDIFSDELVEELDEEE